MTGYDLYLALSAVDDALLERSERPKKRRGRLVRWAAGIAACLALAVAAAGVLSGRGGPDDSPVQAIAALQFNGAYYEAVDIPEVLEKYGLPETITADMAGEHLSYLASDGGVGYEETVYETDIELYTYAPAPCRGVYVLRDGERWMAALFCGILSFDGNTHTELGELYRIYGVGSAADIASVAEMNWRYERTIGAPVTDSAAIGEFYALTTALIGYGNEDFQRIQFGGIPEEQQPAAHAAFADDSRVLRVETAEGLRFFLTVYPEYDWLYSHGALSYNRLDAALEHWLEEKLW